MSELVVVGVDGSSGAERALREAAADARRRGARLRVISAWSYLDQPGGTFDPAFGEQNARELIDRALENVGDAAAGLDIERVSVCDLPARALLDAAKDASLVVVGARGMGGFRGLLLGSVSQQVAQHSDCPVLIVPPGPEEAHAD